MAFSSSFWRYTAFQVPGWIFATGGGWLIHRWFGVPLWLSLGVLVVWVIKDYALYPFLRSAYEVDHRWPIERMIGHIGRTVETLSPTGYVRVRGELWRATTGGSPETIDPERAVEVVGVDGTTLVVLRRDLPSTPALGDDSGTVATSHQPSSESPNDNP